MAVIINLDQEREKGQPDALTRLSDLVTDDLEHVNRLIVEHMHSPVELIPQLAGHIIAAGGKRLRPVLTLAAAQMCGYHGPRHAALAACVEFIHTATLLHDDVVDESKLRRGEASWMARAKSSLPVPVSPRRRTVALDLAAASTRSSTDFMIGLVPMMPACSAFLPFMRAEELPCEG